MRTESERVFSRRRALRYAAAAAALGPLFKLSEGPAKGQMQRGPGVKYGPINKYSSPGNLRITDMRAVTVASNFDYNIIRIDTNQDVYGLGEVRDGGLKGSALVLKPMLVGRNPLDISGLLQSVRPYAGHGRAGGGYSAVDIALHDIAGKVFGVPAWRLLGDKKRDKVKMYADTTGTSDPKKYAARMLARQKFGFKFFKMDVTANFIGDKPGALDDYGIPTDKGLAYGAELITAVRDAIGWQYPLAVDASSLFRRTPGGPPVMPVKDAIRTAKAWERLQLAWLEDLFGTMGFRDWRGYKEIRENSTTKILTGEDAFGLEEGFQPLIDNRALDVIHPDPGTSGACRETKRIADYAAERGIPCAIHMAGSPLGTLAAVHVAATLTNYVAMELHALDFLSWWQDLVNGVPKPILQDGYIDVPDTPGIGVVLNEAVVKEHLRVPGYFEPTPMYDGPIVGGRGPRGPWPHFNVDGKWVNEATSDY
jgi:L-alanine-DL-glutamate epimerase-like enolase superfamily enzyme